jgi:periplasmic protein TonB
MKVKLILVFFCLWGSVSGIEAQFFADTIYYDSYQQIVKTPDNNGFYRIITIDSSNKYQFVINDFYPNGQLKMSGTFRSLNPDNKIGHFNYYYSNGQLQKQCNYRDNMLDGQLKVWYENGNIKQECNYTLDKLTGSFRTYSEDGKLTKFAEYLDGKKNGKFITYYSNGNPIREEKYKNDELLNGKCFTAAGKDTSYFIYFTPPSFLGGDISGFTEWVMKKLQYPSEARDKNEEGEVQVKFTVDKSGSVKGIQITKQDRTYFNSEVLRVIASSPNWKPAIRDIDTVEVSVEIPVKFSIPKK